MDGIIDHSPDGGCNKWARESKGLRGSETGEIDGTWDSGSKARSDSSGSGSPNTLRSHTRNHTTPERALSPASSPAWSTAYSCTPSSLSITCDDRALASACHRWSTSFCSFTYSGPSKSTASYSSAREAAAVTSNRGRRLQFRQCRYL
jgi:hypothetical protein